MVRSISPLPTLPPILCIERWAFFFPFSFHAAIGSKEILVCQRYQAATNVHKSKNKCISYDVGEMVLSIPSSSFVICSILHIEGIGSSQFRANYFAWPIAGLLWLNLPSLQLQLSSCIHIHPLRLTPATITLNQLFGLERGSR